MPFYLIRSKATSQTWADLIENPEDRRAPSVQAESLYGGKVHGYWYAFGEYDVYGLFEAPDNTSAATVQAAISAGGAYSKVEIVPLLSVEEMLAALEQAKSFVYRRPGARPAASS
ncbi:GYD domain-containing protein [Sciscionella marina]|uniref:GYD domain-containing protein n=1 Tax=Sciscionella marina TaxID=508770 RepID=UPI00036AF6FE|nr:GYD domain-containing protein [Sciscionella marina]